MKFFLFFVGIAFALFFYTKVPASMGIKEGIATVAILPMFIYFAINLIAKKIELRKDAVCIIILAVIIFLFKRTIGQNFTREVILLLIFPMILSLCFDNLKGKELTLLRRAVLFFYIAECGMAIVEKIANQNYFYKPGEDIFVMIESGFFRSTSLLGHPLINAMVVAVFMTFIAISKFKNILSQVFLFLLGYIAIFCFGARGAILIVSVSIVPFFIWKLNKIAPPKAKRFIRFGVFCLLLGMFFMVTKTSLGGRMTGMDIYDQNAKTRIEVFNFYKFYHDREEFLWGHPGLYLYMREKLEAGGVENGVISLILYYGIIFATLILLLYFMFQYRRLSVYSKLEKWLVLAVFYLIGNMNPNLTGPIQWVMWVFCYYSFRPELLQQKKPVQKPNIKSIKK